VTRRATGLTRKRNLRTGVTVWGLYKRPVITGSRLRRSTRADVVIVGAGISGALIAHALTEVGIRPLIIDRRRRALLGSTAASTALLQFELDTPLTALGASIGRSNAAKVWTASAGAVNDLRTVTHRLGIRAQMCTRPSLYLAGDRLNASGLRREAVARQKIGLPSEFLDAHTLRKHFDIERPAALLSHGNAEANPIQLAAGFLNAAIKSGARLYAPHEIVELHCSKRCSTLRTADGLDISARHVILSTGYELAKIVPPGDSEVISTWALATRPQPQALWPQRALIWEASEPYLYARTTPDGRVICGGQDAQFSDSAKRDALIPAKTKQIELQLGRLFPHIDPRADVRWAGSFGASSNGMPTIGEIPGYPRCYAVMGFGGNGITFSMLAANLLKAAITGRNDPQSRLFGFK
jgi:glycine/D-amino acid oxidase-like deaminating enzyme